MSRKDHRQSLLLILGHGSSKHTESSLSVREHAEVLRCSGNFGEVRVAFLKEEPLIDDCLSGLDGDNVIIVPDFLAEGYFTRQVIPRKLSGFPAWEKVRYCPPVGSHPLMAELIEKSAIRLLGEWEKSDTSLLVIGHGSGKSACSKQSLLQHLSEVREGSDWMQVSDLWLEEPTRVKDWKDLAISKQVLVLPYLLNDGQHGGWDIPHDLGIAEGVSAHGVTHQLGGFQVRLSPALGKSARFADVITAYADVWG